MNRVTKLCFYSAISVVVLGLFAGCGTSPKPRLFLFTPEAAWRGKTIRDAVNSEFTVRVLPVRLSPYLDRPQIVTRVDENEIKADQFNRWGMPLDRLVREVVAAGIVERIPSAYVDLALNRAMGKTDYLVQIEVMRLDGPLAGPVNLVAQAIVMRGDDREVEAVLRRVASYSIEGAGKSYDEYVSAVNTALGELAGDVAKAIQADRESLSSAADKGE